MAHFLLILNISHKTAIYDSIFAIISTTLLWKYIIETRIAIVRTVVVPFLFNFREVTLHGGCARKHCG